MPDSTRNQEINEIPWYGELSLANFLDWLITMLLSLWVCFTLLQLGGTRPETLAANTLLASVLLILHLCWLAISRSGESTGFHPLLFIFIPFVVYAWINALWITPVAGAGIADALAYSQVFVVFWVAANNLRGRRHIGCLAGAILAAALIATMLAYAQHYRNPVRLPAIFNPFELKTYAVSLTTVSGATGFFGVPGSLGGLMLLAGFSFWTGACLPRFDRSLRLLSAYAALMCALALFLTFDPGSYLAFAAGMLALPLVTAQSGWSRLLGFGGVLLSGLLGASILYFVLPAFADTMHALWSGSYRETLLAHWTAAWQLFLQFPLFGTGLGTYATAFESVRPVILEQGVVRFVPNGPLHTLATTGLIGLLLLWVPIGYLLIRICRSWQQAYRSWQTTTKTGGRRGRARARAPLPYFVLTLVILAGGSFLLHWMVEIHSQIPGLMMIFAILLAVALRQIRAPMLHLPDHIVAKIAVPTVILAVALILPLVVLNPLKADLHVHEGIHRIQSYALEWQDMRRQPRQLRTAAAHLEIALQKRPNHAPAHSYLAVAQVQMAYTDPANHMRYGREAEQHARMAIVLGYNDSTTWLQLGKALWLQGRLDEAGDAFAQALEKAPASAMAWYYRAAYLNAAENDRGAALQAVERSLELAPNNSRARDLRQRILIP